MRAASACILLHVLMLQQQQHQQRRQRLGGSIVHNSACQPHACQLLPLTRVLPPACRAVADRVDWAAREVAGGKDAFVLLMCSLVNAALPGHALLQPGAEAAKAFAQSARRVLEHVAQAGRPRWAGAAAEAGSDVSEVVLSLAAAMREVAAAAAGS